MAALIGRESELRLANDLLKSSAEGQIVRALRIAGPSGIGKTTVLNEIVARATAEGWLVAVASAHRIQSNLPLFTARRIIQALVSALGDDADRYVSTLPLDRDQSEDFEDAFLRAIEGISLDHRIIFAVDDAQWADAESSALIIRTLALLADRTIVLLTTERLDDVEQSSLDLHDTAIALVALSNDDVTEIVLSIYPEAPQEVTDSIATASRGYAMDIVALADAARNAKATSASAVGESMRRVVAREISLLDAKARGLLQMCALIEEPIEISFLQQVSQKDELMSNLALLSGRYLVESEGNLRFVHSLLAQSVRETIALEIPLRQRIIEGLKDLPLPRLDDLERLAAQAAAVGDRGLERQTLLKLAEAAAAKSFLGLAATSTERAFAIEPASASELVPLYIRLANIYHATGRETEVIRICRDALRRAAALDLHEGIGAIVASLTIALWHWGDREGAKAEVAHHLKIAQGAADRAQLITAAEIIAAHTANAEDAQALEQSLLAIEEPVHPMVMLRHHSMQAFLSLRHGKQEGVLENLRLADRIAENLPPVASAMPRSVRLVHAFRFAGVGATENLMESDPGELHDPLHRFMRGMTLLARGQTDDLQLFVKENIARRGDNMVRRQLLSAIGTAYALAPPMTTPAWDEGEQEVSAFMAGDRANALVPIVTAWIAMKSRDTRADLGVALEQLFKMHLEPFDFSVFVSPIVLVHAAKNLEAKEVLHAIAEGSLWHDLEPWSQAQHLLGQGAAANVLGLASGPALLRDARERFDRLGATLFANVAVATGSATPVSAASPPEKTTRREREVAALVAEGMTNREIAEKLVLSERTVEGHIANLFAKVNANSRTQLATWFLRSATASS